MTPATAQSPLMRLPGELQNQIWRYAAVEKRVLITSAGLSEPGLLMTCKEIREEAGAIFYAESQFYLVSRDYDSTAARHWPQKVMRCFDEFGVLTGEVRVVAPGAPCWGNLIVWLRSIHQNADTLSPNWNPEIRTERLVITGMFYIVKKMQLEPWAAVEELLLQQRVILGRLDARWED